MRSGAGLRRRDESARASIAAAHSVLERELGLDRERLSVQLRVGIDEVVERIAPLWWVEADVSSDSKLQAIVVVRPEEIVFLLRVLPGFRRVNRYPAVGLDIELRPAMIARHGPIMLISGQRKTNFEARGDSGRPHHADKQRVEISAVAAFGRAGPYRIAGHPTGAGLVVTHRGDHVVVDCSRFLQWVLDTTRLLRREICDDPLERHAAVRLKETWENRRVRRRRLRADQVRVQLNAVFLAGYLKAHANLRQRVHLCRRNLQIKVLVAVFRIAVLRIGERRFDFHAADRLVWIRLRQRNPNSQTFGSRGAGGNSSKISKFEVAYGSIRLRPGRVCRPESSERKSKSKTQSNGPARNHWRKPPSENR